MEATEPQPLSCEDKERAETGPTTDAPHELATDTCTVAAPGVSELNTEMTAAKPMTGPADAEMDDDTPPPLPPPRTVSYESYTSELQMPDIMQLMKVDLSEPYSIYTYRYFIHNWPQLCILAKCDDKYVGAIVCKLEMHHYQIRRGYIAMLAVDRDYRKRRIGTNLVLRSVRQMVLDGCDEVVLETEVTNEPALKLYENLGFIRDKYLHQYYLNGVDAYRLKLWLRDPYTEA